MGGTSFARRAACFATATCVAFGGASSAIANNQSIRAAANAPIASYSKSIALPNRPSPWQQTAKLAKSGETIAQKGLKLNQNRKNTHSLNSALAKKTTTSKNVVNTQNKAPQKGKSTNTAIQNARGKATARQPIGTPQKGKTSNKGVANIRNRTGGSSKSSVKGTARGSAGASKGAGAAKSGGASRGGTSGGSSKGR